MAVENKSMSGRVCLVTGATSGIGQATARALAGLGATVVVVGRNATRARAVAEEVSRATGNPAVESLVADFSSLQQVRALADEVIGRYPRLHVLINNAGAVYTKRQLTADGLEMTFAVDHLAPFLLTNLLLDRLTASAPARIVIVSSDAHRNARIDFDDLGGARRYSAFRAYGQAKLANILFTYELARRLQGRGVTVNCLHPGVVATGFGHNNRGLISVGLRVLAPFVKKPEQGAETVVYLASSPEVEGQSGLYFTNKRPAKTSAASYDQETARRLWDVSATLTGLAPEAAGVL
jgi:NAD(P)-dependent dehydrogenase (short-subunit alcohol dehydrogenase family)